MNLLINKIKEHTLNMPDKTAIFGDSQIISYSQLNTEIQTFIPQLNGYRIGLMMENQPAWAIIDLAIMASHKCCIPIPMFFSKAQVLHMVSDAHIDLLILDKKESIRKLGLDSHQSVSQRILDKEIWIIFLEGGCDQHFSGKITYTSGTTGSPKGVMLSEDSIMKKTVSLADAIQADLKDKGLSLLPMSTLLENIGGLYVPLLVGATAALLAPQKIGILGSNQIDGKKLVDTIMATQPTAFIIVPQLLEILIKISQSGIPLPLSIRFIAVGGAHVSHRILKKAMQYHIPVFQGYGLSEACSVVSLNTVQDNKLGSVGKPLNNHQIKIAEDGEILIKHELFSGYLGHPEHTTKDYFASGDLGKIDSDGYLHILGRKRNIIVNSFGRNISPEWIECELESLVHIARAVIFGDAQPFIIAVIEASSNSVTSHEINQAIQKLNGNLPDYAQVQGLILSREPFSLLNGQLNKDGSPNRIQIYKDYFSAINIIYEKSA